MRSKSSYRFSDVRPIVLASGPCIESGPHPLVSIHTSLSPKDPRPARTMAWVSTTASMLIEVQNLFVYKTTLSVPLTIIVMSDPLTEEEKEFFVQNGWLHLKGCFTREQAEAITGNVWERLGMNPNDKSTWTQDKIHMPGEKTFNAQEFAPKAWAAICELCGGEDRILDSAKWWQDALIVNLGSAEKEGQQESPHDLWGWHVDGDFFVHYLDSPEQGLLVIPLFTDIAPGAGGTVICPEAMPILAKHLYDNPAGVSPLMDPRDSPDFRNIEIGKHTSRYSDIAHGCVNFVEACGDVGDIFLLHPLILHSASNNNLRHLRIITNPPVGLKEPFKFFRPQGNYSLVEWATMRALGRDNLEGWAITHPREGMTPPRLRG